MGYLVALAKHGIRASIRPGGALWLEPKANITDRIREVVQANKAAIIAELQSEQAQRGSSACTGVTADGNDSIPVSDTRRVKSSGVQASQATCGNCGGRVTLYAYECSEIWAWYECSACDDCQAVELVPELLAILKSCRYRRASGRTWPGPVAVKRECA